MKKGFKILLLVALLITVLTLGKKIVKNVFFSPTKSGIPTGFQTKTDNPAGQDSKKKDIEVIVENLNIPWDIAFLPGGDLLVTERPGNLLRIGADKKVIKIEGVAHIGEGGLLGLALHPKFSENNFIYL